MKITNVVGWIAIVIVTFASSFWAFWGVNEAFHEGWCRPTLGLRLLQVCSYLAPGLALTAMAAVSLRWPRAGSILFVLAGGAVAGLIIKSQANFSLFITVTLTIVPILVGILFLFGRPKPVRIASAIAIGLPLLIIIGFGTEPVFRVSSRFDDGDRSARLIQGNEVTLKWAPAGPGWTREGLASWDEAMCRVSFLNESGTEMEETSKGKWRLPTREELVRSLTRSNQNAGGSWDSEREVATYQIRPDKESPVWDPYAPLIYLWTSEESSEDRAWIVVYDGGVYSKPKSVGSPSFGFRAVRVVPNETGSAE